MDAAISNRPSSEEIPGADFSLVGVNLDAPTRPSYLGNIPHIGPYAVRSLSGRDLGRPYQLDLLFFPGAKEKRNTGVIVHKGIPGVRISFAHGSDDERKVVATYEVALDQVSIKTPAVLVVYDQWALAHHGIQGRNRHSPQDHKMILEIVSSHKADIEAFLNDPDLIPVVADHLMTDPAAWIADPALHEKIPYSHLVKMGDFLNKSFGLDVTVRPVGRGIED